MSPSISALRPIQTAEPTKTVWCQVSEDDFRKNLVTLEKRTNAVPADVLNVVSDGVNNIHPDASFLPLEVEKQVADDVAYIAAVTEGAQSVAAVCLEQHINRDKATLVMKIAGMDVVDEDVRTMLGDIVEVLRRVSQVAIPSGHMEGAMGPNKQEAVEELFGLIILQHKQKLLGRLRSKKWTKPKHLSRTHKKPLWRDFENLAHRVQHVLPKRSDWKTRKEANDQLLALGKIYKQFEDIDEIDSEEHLRSLVRMTYSFCKETAIQRFAFKLEGAGATSQIFAATKTLHQLEKIGAYWRLSETLVATTSRYPRLFSDIRLKYLTPYASVPTSIAYESWAKTCHVHAEIQLVVDYALRSSATGGQKKEDVVWPRAIGTSKYLCYLCYLFLRYHSQFLMLNTHGRLYDQWTVPDLKEYNEQTRVRFADVLMRIDTHVCEQIEDAQKPVWRIEPMTSRQDLLRLDEEAEIDECLASEMRNLCTG